MSAAAVLRDPPLADRADLDVLACCCSPAYSSRCHDDPNDSHHPRQKRPHARHSRRMNGDGTVGGWKCWAHQPKLLIVPILVDRVWP